MILNHKITKMMKVLAIVAMIGSYAMCSAQFGGGAGTADNPYQIGRVEHLNSIRGEFLAANIYFIQTANLDLDVAPWNEDEGWVPIGDGTTRFQGHYDGNNFTISGLTINRTQSHQGLFGGTSGGVFKRITITDVNISNCGAKSGVIIGQAANRIENCTTSGSLTSTVAGGTGIGGLIGYYSGQMYNCISHVDVTARNSDRVGGLIGDSWGSSYDCYATGEIIGNNRVGGLCGNDYNSTHERIMASGNVTGNDEVGGLYGFVQTATYKDCYATGNVTGVRQVGGLIGNYNLPTNVNQQLFRGYSIGEVTGNDLVGGMIGRVAPNMQGPFDSYWNVELSGQRESAGGAPLTIAEMLEAENFRNWVFGGNGPWRIDPGSFPYLAMEGDQAGDHNFPTEYLPPRSLRFVTGENRDRIHVMWNEPLLREPIGYNIYRGEQRLNEEMIEELSYLDTDVEIWTLYIYDVTSIYMVDGEPEESVPARLRAIITEFEGGDGSVDNPYQIATAEQLRHIANLPASNYMQTANIDIAEIEWRALGTEDDPFTGKYDGNDFTISGLNLTSTQNNIGLFGYTAGANLIDICLEDAEVSGGNFVGTLVGNALETTILECSAEGRVSGNSQVGGLTGQHSGRMDYCNAHVDVEGTGREIGGLIGYGAGHLQYCYAAGSVLGSGVVGGLIGNSTESGVSFCFAVGTVEGTDDIGGLVGVGRGSRIHDCYATGGASGRSGVGGLMGTSAARVHFCYSLGRVSGQNEIGGLIGRQTGDAFIEYSYWNVDTSGQNQSAGGEGRDERHMTYPYTEDTYERWDFERTWRADIDYDNCGYPYLTWQPLFDLPYPNTASSPIPANATNGVSIDIEELRWSYMQGGAYAEPAGFRVYFNETGEFGEDDDFEWVRYDEDLENYSCEDILPEELDYLTTYYWKVVPTTTDPTRGESKDNSRKNSFAANSRDGLMLRNDAQNVPVWRFTTERYANPVVATNPIPEDGAEEVSIKLEEVKWSYTIDVNYSNPAGFRVYLNTTGDFGEDDDFVWVPFFANQNNYASSAVLPEEIEYAATYYWKVVPTTDNPDQRQSNSRRSLQLTGSRDTLLDRGDAENVEVWSFSTILKEPYPLQAKNPNPEHLAVGVSAELNTVSWEYHRSDVHTDPVGFRVYMNRTGGFGSSAPYVWVDYVEDQEVYYCSDVVPTPLDTNSTYYWRVIPTTINPDEDRRSDGSRNDDYRRAQLNAREDAPNCPTWRFTTEETSAEDEALAPLITSLLGNYPNPFNPETTISYSLAEAGDVQIEIYNSRGQKITTLVNEHKRAGLHRVMWDGKNEYGKDTSSGVYFYRMIVEDKYDEMSKMLLIK